MHTHIAIWGGSFTILTDFIAKAEYLKKLNFLSQQNSLKLRWSNTPNIDGHNYVEGVDLTTQDGAGPISADGSDPGNLHIGNRSDNLRPLAGPFYEGALFKYNISSANRTRLRNHMSQKYEVTLE